jgi:hypothetical protein
VAAVTAQDLFAEEARKQTGYTDPDDYYYKEFESALDHMELDSQSEFAWKFFVAGMNAQEALKNEPK